METDFHYPSDFCLFLVTFGNDIFWNSQISIKWLVSTFRCWQFSRSSFFCTKNITKKLILEFQLSAPHLVGFGPQKEYPFDPCQYRGFLFLHFFNTFNFFCFQDITWNYIQKALNSLLCWFLAVIRGLPGVRMCNGITLKSAFFSKPHKFFKIL